MWYELIRGKEYSDPDFFAAPLSKFLLLVKLNLERKWDENIEPVFISQFCSTLNRNLATHPQNLVYTNTLLIRTIGIIIENLLCNIDCNTLTILLK